MQGTTMESTVEQSRSNLVLDDELDSVEWNQLQTEYVKKPSKGIDQVQDSFEGGVQYFSDVMPSPNKWLP